jgi:protein TonB
MSIPLRRESTPPPPPPHRESETPHRREEQPHRREEQSRRRFVRDDDDDYNDDEPKGNGGVIGFIKKNIKAIGIVVVAIALLLWFYNSCMKTSDTPMTETEKVVKDNESGNDVTPEQESESEPASEVEENTELPTDEETSEEIEAEEIVTEDVEAEEVEAEKVVEDVSDVTKEDKTVTNVNVVKQTPKTTTKTVTNTTDTKKVYDVAEQMPSYPGGQSAMMSFLSKNLVYPEAAQKRGAQGRVTVSFVVETDGSLTGFKVARSADPDLDREALRVVKMMPRWQPGKKGGKAVRVKYTVPITFKI